SLTCTSSATPELYALSLHDALPIYLAGLTSRQQLVLERMRNFDFLTEEQYQEAKDDTVAFLARKSTLRYPFFSFYIRQLLQQQLDRKSTRLNSSHVKISYAVFCLKK